MLRSGSSRDPLMRARRVVLLICLTLFSPLFYYIMPPPPPLPHIVVLPRVNFISFEFSRNDIAARPGEDLRPGIRCFPILSGEPKLVLKDNVPSNVSSF